MLCVKSSLTVMLSDSSSAGNGIMKHGMLDELNGLFALSTFTSWMSDTFMLPIMFL